jgi:hypothetical protein
MDVTRLSISDSVSCLLGSLPPTTVETYVVWALPHFLFPFFWRVLITTRACSPILHSHFVYILQFVSIIFCHLHSWYGVSVLPSFVTLGTWVLRGPGVLTLSYYKSCYLGG